MKEKTPQEQKAQNRQADLLCAALEQSAQCGYWLNIGARKSPIIYPKGTALSSFNSIMLGLHTDANGYDTDAYMSFADAMKAKQSVLKGEKSVPMFWYNWSKMVNRMDDTDIIPREEYDKLDPEQKMHYKALRQREVRHMFNVEQTTFPINNEEEMEKLKKERGDIGARGNYKANRRENFSQVKAFAEAISKNLVPIRKSVIGEAYYDNAKDAIYMPNQSCFKAFDHYANELMRKAVEATGHRERLCRQAAMAPKDKVLPESLVAYEKLVQEIAAGCKMQELGMSAFIKEENVELIPSFVSEIRNNPCLMDALEADVNAALDVLHKAEKGIKQEFASKRNARETSEWRDTERSQMTCEDALVMQDILRHGGMRFDDRNFPKGNEQIKDFLDRYQNLSYYRDQLLLTWWNAREVQKEPELIEAAFTAALGEGQRLHQTASELLPREWEQKGTHEIAEKLVQLPDERSQTIVVVADKETGIHEVILPGNARSGGNVVMPSGERRNFWITPDEVMSYMERKEAGAKVVRCNSRNIDKDRIEAALMDVGASYVRFYETEGQLKFRPNDQWFEGKEIAIMQTKGKELIRKGEVDVADAVKAAKEVSFEKISMVKDDDGKWTLLLKESGQPSYGVHPDRSDLNRFFTTMKTGDQAKCDQVRNELAQKYHAKVTAGALPKVDLFCSTKEGLDTSMFERVKFFKTKDNRLMCAVEVKSGEKIPPKEITKEQWQRMWLADDLNEYKSRIAALVFGDALGNQKDQEQQAQKEESLEPEETVRAKSAFKR